MTVPLSPSQLLNFLIEMIPTQEPIWVWGQPGVGKSQIICQATAKLGLELALPPPAVTLDPVDVRGLPSVQGRLTEWLPPNFWPQAPDWKGVIFLDELPQAAPAVQSCFMQMVCQPRRIGDYSVPAGATFVVASNRQEDRSGVHRVIKALLSRFTHVDLVVSVEDWVSWAIEACIKPVVVAYANFKPDVLSDFDPKSDARAFGCGRSLAGMSRALDVCRSDETLYAAAAGKLGEGHGAQFCAFHKIWQSLPDPAEILKNPLKAPVPQEPDVLFALSGALAEKAKGTDTKTLGNICKYVLRMPQEFSTLTMRDAASYNRQILGIPEAAQWLAKNYANLLPDRN